MVQQEDLRVIGAPEVLRCLLQLRLVAEISRQGGDPAVGKQILEVVPLLEGEDHVRPHDQGQP